MGEGTYICELRFRDDNMFMRRAVAKNEKQAKLILNKWVREFAAIKLLSLITPSGDKHVFNDVGNYLFTIPSRVLKNE